VTIDIGTVDGCSEDELAVLKLQGHCEDSNREGGHAEGMPPHGLK
jgi:hypothetical protein